LEIGTRPGQAKTRGRIAPKEYPNTRRSLSEPETAVLLTILYSDLFDYPLTVDQVSQYLCLTEATPAQVDEAVSALVPETLSREGDQVCWDGREEIFELRSRREGRARHRLGLAKRYAAWLRWVPFLRMVALSGSQAAGNAQQDSDLDFFILTEPKRLWIVQLCAGLLRHFGSWKLGISICPNFFLTLDSLTLTEQDLYMAREIAQVQPLEGRAGYCDFLEANGWVRGILPNLDLSARASATPELVRSKLAARLEKILSGFAGDMLDRLIHGGLLAYYRLRLAGRGWSLREIRNWYTIRHQKVMHGGYGPVVMARFRQSVERRLGGPIPAQWLDRLGASRTSQASPDPEFVNLMHDRYGGSH